MGPIDLALKELTTHMWFYGERIRCKVMLHQSLTQSCWHSCAQRLGNQPKKPTMIAQWNKMIGRVIEIVDITVGEEDAHVRSMWHIVRLFWFQMSWSAWRTSKSSWLCCSTSAPQFYIKHQCRLHDDDVMKSIH